MKLLSQNQSILEATCLFWGSLFLFLWGIDALEVIGFESRFYLFAQEMQRFGPSIFPTTYHHPYPDYPGMATFLIYGCAKLLGGLCKISAVLPNALAASVTVLMTYLIGSEKNKTWGWAAAAFLLLTIHFMKAARSISLDMYPAMITSICFYLLMLQSKRANKIYTVCLYALLFFGFTIRGPIGLVIPAGVIFIYYLMDKQYRSLFIFSLFSGLLLIFCMTVLLFIAFRLGGLNFLLDVLRMELIGRMGKDLAPRYFYLTSGMGNYAFGFPMGMLVLLGAIIAKYRGLKLNYEDHLFKLIAWVLLILIGMSIPGEKKTRYILPLMPAMALIASYPFASSDILIFLRLRQFLIGLFLLLPSILILILQIASIYLKLHQIDFPIPIGTLTFFMALMQVMSVLFYYRKQLNAVLFIAPFCFFVTYLFVFEPIEQHLEQSQHFIRSIENARLKDHANLIFFHEKKDGLPIKYLIHANDLTKPLFLDNASDLIHVKEPAYFVAKQINFDRLQKNIKSHFKMVGEAKIAHQNVVVFKKT